MASALPKLSWLAIPVGIYLLWLLLLFIGQRRLLYPRHLVNSLPDSVGAPERAERIDFDAGVGGLAWYLAPDAGEVGPKPEVSRETEGEPEAEEGRVGRHPGVVFAHGNAELARDWTGAFRSLAREGVGVMLVEYPGYGDAPGSPSKVSIRRAMTAAYDSLVARPEIDPARIVGLGRSLGSGAVAELARERRLAGLVLQSPLARVRDLAHRFLAPGFLVRDDFDVLSAVEAFDGPVLVFHGRADRVVPYAHGRRVADAARDGELVTWEGGHNDTPPEWEPFVDRIVDFVGALDRDGVDQDSFEPGAAGRDDLGS